jgi:predicted Zn-dependent protease
MRSKRFILAVLAASLLLAAAAQSQDVVTKAMKDEMARSVKDLRLPNVDKPYFIAYRVEEKRTTSISASLGALTGSNTRHYRDLSVELRVGDSKLDNTNFLSMPSLRGMFRANRGVPLDDNYGEIRRALWLATDQAYKNAAKTLSAKRAVLAHREEASSLPDFAPEPTLTIDEPPARLVYDRAALEKLARDLSGVFREYPDILSSSVAIVVHDEYTRYLNSEGSWFTRADPLVMFSVSAETRAGDGLPLQDSIQLYGRSVETLSHPAELMARARALAAHVEALRKAPAIDAYEGPVLFEGEAAGEAVAQVLAPALTASRFPVTDQPEFETQFRQVMERFGGNSLAGRLGGRVLPADFDISDQPRTATFEGKPLIGDCQVDDDAVATRNLELVDHGILKAVLATRVPTEKTRESTGSRHTMGASPTNLIITTLEPKTADALKAELLSLAKERGLGYGILIRRAGPMGLSWATRMGATQMGAGEPTAAEVYRVYPDGREELLREVAVDPLTPSTFKDIVAAGQPTVVYNGLFIPLASAMFGMANLGGDASSVVSYVTPSLLFDDVSLKKSSGPAPNGPVAPSPLRALQPAGAAARK